MKNSKSLVFTPIKELNLNSFQEIVYSKINKNGQIIF